MYEISDDDFDIEYRREGDGRALYVFGNAKEKLELSSGHYVSMPDCDFLLTPILYSIPLQILSYEVALLRGTDIDQPRNLAKSVTVE